MKPSEVDLKEGLLGTFGATELEAHAVTIIRYLTSHENDWSTTFRMTDIDIEPTWFAIMCAGGWIDHTWFPKGTFRVSQGFVDRVTGNE